MAKTDMERIGLFTEMGYTTIKDPYLSAHSKPFNMSASKDKQMMVDGLKLKAGNQDGYFSKKFDRVMEGEAYSDMIKIRRQWRLKELKKNLAGPYVPPAACKEPSGLGNHYGTLGGPVPSFSAALKTKPKYTVPGKNVLVNPGKIGTGYGYTNITIGSLPKHLQDEFDRAQRQREKEHKESLKKQKAGAFKLNLRPTEFFEKNPYHSDKPARPPKEALSKKERLKPFVPSKPGKAPGGCKAGTFESYPKHSEDEYIIPKFGRPGPDKSKMKGGVFRPPQDIKSRPITSVVHQNVIKRMNVGNYRTMSVTV